MCRMLSEGLAEQIDPYQGLPVLQWAAYDDPGWDFDTFGMALAERGGRSLEIGVGAGRLLRRFLAAGLDVEGVDAAPEMLAACREKALADGLEPVLYQQAMQDLDLPGLYNTIYVPCGTVAVLASHEQLLEALRAIRRHLLPGGALVFNTEPLEQDFTHGGIPTQLPESWVPHVQITVRDGESLEVERRTAEANAVEQTWREERRYTLRRSDGSVVQGPDVHATTLRWSTVAEMRLLLAASGYVDVSVTTLDLTTPYGPGYDGPVLFTALQPS